MANLQKLIDLDGLSYFLGQIKAKFVRSVNGAKPDSKGNVNIANMTGASDSAAGKAGLAPAPAAGAQNKFLCADATWKDAGGLPVGHEFFTTNPNIPAGCIPLLGGEYSRTTYADLWAWVQTQSGYLLEESAWQAKAAANGGNVPFYSKGDGSTTFRVPALPLAKCITGESLGVKGNGMTLGLTDGTVNFGVQRYNYTPGGYFVNPLQGQETKFGSQIGEAADTKTPVSNKQLTVGLVADAQKTGIIVDLSNQVNGLWCVKAYGTVTNVGSTDVANISTGLTEAETRISALENHGAGATVVKSYRNGTEWYRVWSDGWVEQGGLATMSYNVAHNLLKPFADTNYSVFLQLENADTHYTSAIIAHTVSSFTPQIQWTSNYSECNNLLMYWYACGQGA